MKIKAILAILIMTIIILMATGCPKPPCCGDPVFTPTPFALFDDFATIDNQTDSANFGGYWYTFDDLTASTDNITCGVSKITPMSANAKALYGYSATVQFVMAVPDSNPPNITSGYCARVSGTVSRSGYPYGFAGFGANLLDNNDETGTAPKLTMNATALGYTRLQFWYKNGPSLGTGATVPWKVKLPNTYSLGACAMEDGDDVPVKTFTSTDTWQKFDVAFTDFAPEGWGATTCGTRGSFTTCITGVNSSRYDPTAKYRCTAAQALTMLTAIQWQTNFNTVTADNPYDLEIAYVAFIK